MLVAIKLVCFLESLRERNGTLVSHLGVAEIKRDQSRHEGSNMRDAVRAQLIVRQVKDLHIDLNPRLDYSADLGQAVASQAAELQV